MRNKIFSLLFLLAIFTYSPLKSEHSTLQNSSISLISNHVQENGTNAVFASAYQLLNQATHSILIANYVYENTTITSILNQKAEAGLDITVVYDRERSKTYINQLHPSIKKLTRASGDGHMHHKFIVVDNLYSWISSANFNSTRDTNLAIIHSDPLLAQVLYQESEAIAGQSERKIATPYITTSNGQQLEVYLLPHNDPNHKKPVETEMNELAQKKLLSLIKQAEKTIRVSMVVWTFKDSARALVEAAQRGVDVEVVTANIDPAVQQILREGGVKIRSVTNAPFHHKMMLVDHKILWTGSANWSMNAFSRTDDSVTVLYNLTTEQQTLMHAAWEQLLQISR